MIVCNFQICLIPLPAESRACSAPHFEKTPRFPFHICVKQLLTPIFTVFSSSTATGSSEYEIMIWLAALGGAGPISSTGSPVSTPTIAGVSWKLYSGPNGAMTVYSFVAASEVTKFSGDLKLFLTYLATNYGYSTSQYLTSIGAGTEPFTGTSAVLSVSAYSVVINLGSSGSGTTTTTKAATSTTSKAASSTGAPLYGQCGMLRFFLMKMVLVLFANLK